MSARGGGVNAYTPILVLGALAAGFAIFSVAIAPLTGPRRYNLTFRVAR